MCIKALYYAWKSELGLPSVAPNFTKSGIPTLTRAVTQGKITFHYWHCGIKTLSGFSWLQFRRADSLEFNIPDGWTLVRCGGCVCCYGGDHSIHNRLSYCSELRYNNLDTIANNTNKSWYFYFLSLQFQSMGRVGALDDMYWRWLWTREKVQDKEESRTWTRRDNLWACGYSSWSSRRYHTEYMLAGILLFKTEFHKKYL